MAAQHEHHHAEHHPVERNAGMRFPMFAVALGAVLVLALIAFFAFGIDPSDNRIAAEMPDTGQRAPATSTTSGG